MENENENGFLIISMKKGVGSIVFRLEDGKEIRVFLSHHTSKNQNLVKALIRAPRSIKIDRSDENVQDYKK